MNNFVDLCDSNSNSEWDENDVNSSYPMSYDQVNAEYESKSIENIDVLQNYHETNIKKQKLTKTISKMKLHAPEFISATTSTNPKTKFNIYKNSKFNRLASVIATKVPNNNQKCHAEVGLVVNYNVLENHNMLEKLLEMFSIQSDGLTIVQNTFPNSVRNKKDQVSKDSLVETIERNKAKSMVDKTGIQLHFSKALNMPGLCLWSHRKVEMGGSCNLGASHSTIFPFVVIVYQPQRFVDLIFANHSSSTVYDQEIDEFENLHQEMINIRQILSGIIGHQEVHQCRITLLIAQIETYALSKLKSQVIIKIIIL
jgi:hypothetical protein